MGLRWFFVVAMVFGLTPEAFAGERSGGIFHRASCSVIRYYVAKYSESAAEAWARSNGATEAEIEPPGTVSMERPRRRCGPRRE